MRWTNEQLSGLRSRLALEPLDDRLTPSVSIPPYHAPSIDPSDLLPGVTPHNPTPPAMPAEPPSILPGGNNPGPAPVIPGLPPPNLQPVIPPTYGDFPPIGLPGTTPV
jgi:hypothetical protein